MIERHAVARHKTFIKGRIYFNNRLSSVDCIVRDVTDVGARLEASQSVALPDAFELYLPTKDEHFRAQVEWRRGSHLGVSWSTEQAAKQGASRSEHSIVDRVAKLEHDLAALQRRFDSLRDR
jgi:hypothetical protein